MSNYYNAVGVAGSGVTYGASLYLCFVGGEAFLVAALALSNFSEPASEKASEMKMAR